MDEEQRDDMAVDEIAEQMKRKLTLKRLSGKYGWHDPTIISRDELVAMLREHVERFDWLDVCNLAMMLHLRSGRGIDQ